MEVVVGVGVEILDVLLIRMQGERKGRTVLPWCIPIQFYERVMLCLA
jgi:hypothetical protein